MLVQLERVANSDTIAINPEGVAALFDAETEGQAIVRLGDGRRGFLVKGTFDSLIDKFPHLVTFVRAKQPALQSVLHTGEDEGEDDGIGAEPPPPPALRKIALAPHFATVVFAMREAGTTCVRVPGGQGYAVRASFTEVMDQLQPTHLQHNSDRSYPALVDLSDDREEG